MTAVLLVLVGVALSGYLVRGYLGHAPDQLPGSDENARYVYRLVEFRAALAEGHLSPQWAPDFRGGLGSPFFSYYQPAFFYAASALPASMPPARTLGLTAGLFAILGFLGMVALVRRFFDTLSGLFAAVLLLMSPYSGTNLYLRGDLSEFAAMMCLPPLLWAFFSCLDAPGRGAFSALVVLGGLLVCAHPCVALPAFCLLAMLALFFLVRGPTRRNAATTLVGLALGGSASAFYSLPVFFEMHLVGYEGAFTDHYFFANHFVSPLDFLGGHTRTTTIPFTLGGAVLVAVLVNAAWWGYTWRRQSRTRRRLVLALGALALASLFLMTPASRPIWRAFGPLQFLQFPWRLLSITTVALAGLGGPLLFGGNRMARAGAFAAILVSAGWLSLAYYTGPLPPTRFTVPETPASLADEYLAPDLRDEWLPRGAATEFAGGVPRRATWEPDSRPAECRRDHARFRCELADPAGGRLTLPHYYFPVGWKATLEGRSLAVSPSSDGLMTVAVPPGSTGSLAVAFSMTPARKLGWVLTLLTAVATLLSPRVLGMGDTRWARWSLPPARTRSGDG